MSTFDAMAYGSSGIADEYDDLYADEWDTPGAVACLVELAAGGPVLEFGIGTGRLSLPLRDHGLEVHGVDASPEMVARLRDKPGGSEIPVTIGNFSDVDAGGGFALVVLAVNTIFALPDQGAQVACFANAARHLAPAGAFVVEAWIPDVGAFRNNRLVRQRVLRDDAMSIESAVLEPAQQRMRTVQAVLRNGSVRLYPANHRYAWPAELDLMAQLAGLHLESRWSTWQQNAFDDDSRHHISVYRAAGAADPAHG